jgi:hypothetical protein
VIRPPPRQSDRPPPRRPITSLANTRCAPRSIDDSNYDSRGLGIHDSARASRDSSVPAPLASPLGYAEANDTAATLAITTNEDCTDGTFGQSSSDDHAGKAGFPAAGRKTHIIGHHVIASLSSAHLCPHRPRRPVLVPCHGGRI